jgi:hypothetical protein
LPELVRDNLLVVLFGLCQFEAFGYDHGLPVPEQLDFKVILDPVIKQVCGLDGTTRSAIDRLLEHLATMVELGKLRFDVHVAKTPEGWLALRLDPCLAEFRRFVRETALTCEVLDKPAYLEQLRQNLATKGYVSGCATAAWDGRCPGTGGRARGFDADLGHRCRSWPACSWRGAAAYGGGPGRRGARGPPGSHGQPGETAPPAGGPGRAPRSPSPACARPDGRVV